MKTIKITKDVLIIGGGTAGCFAAYILGSHPELSVLIAEKANIKRSGCLAAGVNALNAYITEGKTPQYYVDYAMQDAKGIAREDLLLSMSERLNHVTKVMEDLGLVILKDENGKYVARGTRNIKINGENIKPLLAEAALAQKNVTVLNHINITDLLVENNTVYGACGFDVNQPICYEIHAKAVLVATGGAAGLYRPNNPGFSRHKMWYPPFNTGAGYAMGILAGAEMTTFEMRFIALRCKDTIAPTGTIAQGVGAKQINAEGRIYEQQYGIATCERVYGTVMENRQGRGPCYLKTDEISKEQEQDLYKAYLNMAPSQTLKWLEAGKGPSEQNVEIEGTEPYIVGGHTASGYWIDNDRATTVKGLYAAGDVAGGAPQKYVTGAMAEGEIAAEAIAQYIIETAKTVAAAEEKDTAVTSPEGKDTAVTSPKGKDAAVMPPLAQGTLGENNSGVNTETTHMTEVSDLSELAAHTRKKLAEYSAFLERQPSLLTTEQMEETMQKIMDQYAGGISTGYQYSEASLTLAREKIQNLQSDVELLSAADMDELLQIYELKERLVVCLAVIAHLSARKETRWHSFAEHTDYPNQDDTWLRYVNSRMEDGEIRTFTRERVTGGNVYEHKN